ncbi:unnamed protein product [Staurois parvus]|uniref:Uncharacterized protein n=1 Tax=Staurois parvus TaxID=386267 RepID=A0ABN9HEP5_9NEOB|nr:unnamed protein product [Staurois parvus]
MIAENLRRGEGGELYVNKTVLLPVSSCTLLCMVQCAYSEAQTQPHSKTHPAHSEPFDCPTC